MALTPEEIDGLRELIVSIYGPIAEELLRDLCRCIAAAGGVTSGAEYKLLLAKSLAGADNVIEDTLRRQTDLTDEAVEQLMQWAAEKTAPLENSESLRNIADAYVEVTRNEVTHVLGKLAAADVDGRVYPIKDVYRRTMDYVFRQVSSGAKTPEEAVRRATLRLWQRGIRTIERSDGRSFSVEYMAQRAIMSKMGEMTTAINEKHHNDGGYDGWEISAHSACAPDHESIQGRQYSDEEYKTLNSRLQRRIGTLSCKHIAWPIKLGVDKPQWTQEQLAELAQQNAQGITYEGRHYTQYEATQQQKALENSIRQCKDRIAAAQEQGELGSGELRSSRILLRQLKAEYERFSAAAGLPTAPERLQAAAKLSGKNGRLLNQLTYLSDFSDEERKSIEEELAQLPHHVQKMAESCIKGIRHSDENFGAAYNPRTQEILLCDHREKNALVHEYAHALERVQKIYENPTFRKIMKKGLESLTLSDIIEDDKTFSEPIYRIESDKFVSLYQGRLYESYGIYDGNQIMLDGMREYFAEGFRVYFEEPELLRLRDPDLYRYIEELVK